MTCIDRITVLARLPGISQLSSRNSVLWVRRSALDAARMKGNTPANGLTGSTWIRGWIVISGGDGSFAHSDVCRRPAGLSLFRGSWLPWKTRIFWMHGVQPGSANARRTRALGGQQCGNDIAYGNRTPITHPTLGTAGRTTESLRRVSSGKLAMIDCSSIERPRKPGCDSGFVS